MLEQKVEAFLNRHHLSFVRKKLIIGVSGGPDSLSLLHFLWKRKQLWELTIVAAHLDHMFRGEESYFEAVFVKEFCKQLDIPFQWAQINVKEYMETTGKSSQVGARECRYQFFKEVMEKYQADYLVLGHHGDDQIETMLMRMTRGGTGRARAGIPIRRPFHNKEVIRPFLAITKQDIENYCRENGLNPRRDPSNEKPIYSRNRFRKQVLPFLKSENPNVHEQFQRMSEELYQDGTYLEELTEQKMNTVIESRNDRDLTIDIEAFHTMPIPLQRRGIQLILNYLYKVRPSSLSAIHIDLIFRLLSNPHPSGELNFPEGLQIIRSYQKCHFLFEQRLIRPYFFEFIEPGTKLLPNGYTLKVEYVNGGVMKTNNSLLLNPQKTSFPLIVRTRKIGDRIHLKGMNGTKKIKDIFIDEKVPLIDRDEWPIVTDTYGSVIWIPELKKSVYDASDEELDCYLLLTYIRH